MDLNAIHVAVRRWQQAKILSNDQFNDLLLFATTRYPLRNRVIVLLSLSAGLRAGEIANLIGTWWPMDRARSAR